MMAGAVAPDLVYYLPVAPVNTHSMTGLVVWDVLLGLILLYLVRVAADPLLALAPNGLRSRVPEIDTGFRPWPETLTTIVAILLGAATHLIWDPFTQTNGVAVRHWEWLRITVWEPHKLYNVIGYVSALGGSIVSGAAAIRWYRRTPADIVRPGLPTRIRRAMSAGLVTLTVCGAAAALTEPASRTSGYDCVRSVLVGAVQTGAFVTAVYVLARLGTTRMLRADR